MNASADHNCPGCGTPLKHNPRYPWYFCNTCREQASDCEGRRLAFGNAAVSGGLSWYYSDDPLRRDDEALRVICLVAGRPVIVSEARFGGVVAQPLPGDWHPPDGPSRPVDLSRRHFLQGSRARLK